MTLLNDVKGALRISQTQTAFDVEITDLIESAKQELILAGVTSEKANDDTNTLVKRAVTVYVKANFGWDNPDAERLQKSYELIKNQLTLARTYNAFTITFTVANNGTPIEDATVTFNNEKKVTDSLGVAVFYAVKEAQNMPYTVTKDGYKEVAATIDVENSQSIPIAMVVA